MARPTGLSYVIGSGTFRSVRIDIHDSTIDRFVQPSGSVWKFTRDVSQHAETASKRAAPRRTGVLRASIRAGRPVTTSRDECVARVWARAPYAYFVHEGTHEQAPIRPFRHKTLHLPAWGRWPEIWPKQVRGQDPQPFLEIGLLSARARYGLGGQAAF